MYYKDTFRSLLSLLFPQKRATREATRFPATALAIPPPRGPRALRWGWSRRIRRADVYSCRLGLACVARLWPFVLSALAAMAAVSNKSSPDPQPTRWSSTAPASDLEDGSSGAWFSPMELSVRCCLRGGGAVAAAGPTLATFVLSGPLLLWRLVLRRLQSSGGEMYRRLLTPAVPVGGGSAGGLQEHGCSGAGLVEGGRRIWPAFLDVVEGGRWIWILRRSGVSLGRRATKMRSSSFAARRLIGSQSQGARRRFWIWASWRLVSFPGRRLDGDCGRR